MMGVARTESGGGSALSKTGPAVCSAALGASL